MCVFNYVRTMSRVKHSFNFDEEESPELNHNERIIKLNIWIQAEAYCWRAVWTSRCVSVQL